MQTVNQKKESTLEKAIYNNRMFLLLGVLIITPCLTFIGTDHTITEIFNDTLIIKKLCYNAIFIFLSLFLIQCIILFFDRKMPWRKRQNRKRWILQSLSILLVVSLLLVFHTFTKTLVIPEWKVVINTLLTTDIPLALILGLLSSFIYFYWYQQHQVRMKEAALIEHLQKPNLSITEKPSISVKKGKKTILIPYEDIAYAFRLDEFNYLVTQNGEKYHFDDSLNMLEENLKGYPFFRLNRQLLAHRTAIKSFQILPNRHLQVELFPEMAENLLVNKNKAARFKKWMKQSAEN